MGVVEDLSGESDGDAVSTSRLYEAAREGRREALELLLARLRPRVEAWVALRMGDALQGRLEADDLVQEILIRAAGGLDSFEPRGKRAFYGWLFTIARNQLHEWRRHYGADKRGAGVRRERMHEGIADSTAGPATRAERDEQRERLLQAIQELPERHRTILRLRVIEHRRNAEAATELGIRPSHASVMLVRAVEALRGRLDASGGSSGG